jgi:hypothetical protein
MHGLGEYCDTAKCCELQMDDGGRADCLGNGVDMGTKVPSKSLTGSPTELREMSMGGTGGPALVQNAFFFDWVGDDAFEPEEVLPESGEFTWVVSTFLSRTFLCRYKLLICEIIDFDRLPLMSPRQQIQLSPSPLPRQIMKAPVAPPQQMNYSYHPLSIPPFHSIWALHASVPPTATRSSANASWTNKTTHPALPKCTSAAEMTR